MFLVAGDAEQPTGRTTTGLPFLRDLLDADPGLERIGVTAYPDGHAFIDRSVLRDALHAKQALLAEAGVAGCVRRRCASTPIASASGCKRNDHTG